jgi:sugar lactone lactonase YvrE
LDYSASNADPTCAAGQTLIVGQVCSLTVTFAPTKAGLRYGAVHLLDGSGNILGTTYLQANGLGPQVAFAPVQAVAKSGLNQPYGIAVDGAGNIYVADTDNSRVVKEVYSNGTYTQAGNAIGSGLNFPTGVAVDGAGDVYIVDTDNNRVVKEVYSNGTYTQAGTTIGSGLNQPYGVAVDGAGNVYIADTGNNRVVEEVYSNGTYTQSSTTIGSGLNAPCGVAVDGAGNVYIADTRNSRVVKEVYSNGTYTQSGAAIGGGLYEPFGVALDGVGDLYIVDSGHSRVLKETYSNGTYSQSGTTIGSGLYLVYSVAVDGAGNVYIADTSNNRVLVERVDTPATVDFTEGGTATTATGVSSAPLATAITNLGNQPLLFPVPSSGLNPATGANFVLETNSDTTCPVVNAGGAAGQIAANATCTLSYLFAPAQVGSITGASVLTDNNMNVAGSTQSITLTGKSTQGTQTAQTITFPQPAATSYPGSATLTAFASSGLAVTYAVTSGPATLSGSTLTYTGTGTVVVTASQAGNVTYAAAIPVSISIGVGMAQSNVSWNPAKLSFYTGATLDNTILDATDSISATISYSEYLFSAGPASATPVSAGTVLKPAGVYGLQALITSNYSGYGTETITLPITVQNMNLFVANGMAGVGSLYNNSTQQTAATSAGGIGAAVDSTGNVWSANADGSGVSRFSNLGVPLANYNAAPAGISSPTAVAVDGAGAVWVANGGNGTVSQYSSAGAAMSPPAGFSTGSTGASAIAIDQSGSVWVANVSGNSVTRMLGAAAPTVSLPSGVANRTLGTQP